LLAKAGAASDEVQCFPTEAAKVCTSQKKQISLIPSFTNNSSAPLDQRAHTLLKVLKLLWGSDFPNRTSQVGK
jgi:hypothetical protein